MGEEAPHKRKPKFIARLSHLSARDALMIGLPALALIIFAFWFAAQFIRPAPPHELTMSTGAAGGAYETYAARYKQILARDDIVLHELPSAGAVENLQRLQDPSVDVDIAFVQGGLTNGGGDSGLVSLGSFYVEPLWVFYRGKAEVQRLTQLRGKRIAVGAEGSGTRPLAIDLLEASGVTAKNSKFSSLSGLSALDALSRNKLDAIFLVGPARSAAVWASLYTPGVRVMNFSRADAFVRRFPYLNKVVLPQGAIDLVRDIPARDLNLVATVATLVAREDFHPALIDLLLRAGAEVHGGPGLFQHAGEFPNAKQVDYPLSKEADRYYKSGVSFLQRYLPFWAATLIDRMVVLLIPLIAVLYPLMKILPGLYTWRVRARIYRWYGELKFLESEFDADPAAHTPAQWLQRLQRLEDRVNRIPTPLAYANQLYMLREHIGLVRRTVEYRLGLDDSSLPR
jgi:TRAP transporter TAXI family solute receptor